MVDVMQCYIYKSLRKEELYVYLGVKDDFSVLPTSLVDSLGKLSFVMEIELTPTRKLARENAVKVLESIENRGFFIQIPPTVLATDETYLKRH